MGRPGRLIVLEGIDGSGKSTLAAGLVARLSNAGRAVCATKEPTDGPLGRRIREIARLGRDTVTKEEELDLFHRDRAEHVRTLVLPALDRGEVVVQDRSFYSTVAYQGERGFDRVWLLEHERAIAPDPDLLLVVDIPAEVALERIRSSRPAENDDFERLDALERVRQIFLALPTAVVLNGRDTQGALLEAAWSAVARVLPPHPSRTVF